MPWSIMCKRTKHGRHLEPKWFAIFISPVVLGDSENIKRTLYTTLDREELKFFEDSLQLLHVRTHACSARTGNLQLSGKKVDYDGARGSDISIYNKHGKQEH